MLEGLVFGCLLSLFIIIMAITYIKSTLDDINREVRYIREEMK